MPRMPKTPQRSLPATAGSNLPTAQACQRHLAHLLDLDAAVVHLPRQSEALPALTDLLPRLLQAQLSGEMLAQQLIRSGPPLVQAPSLVPKQMTKMPVIRLQRCTEADEGSQTLLQQLMSWATEQHWDSRYLAPADSLTLDPIGNRGP